MGLRTQTLIFCVSCSLYFYQAPEPFCVHEMCAERELLLTQTTLTISTFKGWWGVMSKDLQGIPELGQ